MNRACSRTELSERRRDNNPSRLKNATFHRELNIIHSVFFPITGHNQLLSN